MPVIRLTGLKLPLSGLHDREEEQGQLRQLAARRARIAPDDILTLHMVKKSLDARDKGHPAYLYTVDISADKPLPGTPPPPPPTLSIVELTERQPRPVVIGAGPSGLFAALLLARSGLKPLIVEQGKRVEARSNDVQRFWSEGDLDPYSNIQFGEGGAGAFSDGKLTSRSKDSRGALVLQTFIQYGADPSVAYWHKPHLGSDKLPAIIAALRENIISYGGEFRYETELTDIIISQGKLSALVWRDAFGHRLETAADMAILAIGNSSRALYRRMAEQGIAMEAKPFAVGLRIQQSQELIDCAQYGAFAGHPLLGAADYQLTWRDERYDRGCYTFCNCPGGYIVNASSEPGGLAVNGMSLAARDSGWANAAVVAQVFPGRDFGREALSGVEYQYRLEQEAFALGQGGAPLMNARAFMGREADSEPDGAAVMTAKSAPADLRGLFSQEIYSGLCGALLHWQRQIPGFIDHALLAGVESRTSAPLRLLRGADGVSLNCSGLYPAGEGAGYAGGIVSSAIDGLKAAEAMLEHLRQ